MEKCYLCSIQSKTNPSKNEPVLVPVDQIANFISSVLVPDCLLIISNCTTFKPNVDDEK